MLKCIGRNSRMKCIKRWNDGLLKKSFSIFSKFSTMNMNYFYKHRKVK